MVLAIIQARMGSTRLPGKSLRSLAGKPALEWLIDRLGNCKKVDRILVATSTDSGDDPIASFCDRKGISCYRGSESDVLDRYYQAALPYSPEAVVRITGDCPVMDPAVVDDCIALYQAQSNPNTYVSNCVERTYPDGLDVEVFSFRALEDAWRQARLASEREHVTLYIRGHYPTVDLKHPCGNYESLRLTLDHEEDAVVIGALIEALFPHKPTFGLTDMVIYLEKHPEIQTLNSHYDPNEGLKKSLREDRIVRTSQF